MFFLSVNVSFSVKANAGSTLFAIANLSTIVNPTKTKAASSLLVFPLLYAIDYNPSGHSTILFL